ncbi:hypothetical protein SADUNF_Sadunf16G0220500 [Salix dunnii]|uniref:Uncharacterized protein n=1 Tax=Salix dunnii TaxID=1413687 RepID=A0A835MMG0_9ROSI|nr:hypothetical protein SADUNF_Sadunf16G0220500 [Salix dunnii]
MTLMISTRLLMESNENGTKAVEEPTRENIQETDGKEAKGEVPKEEVADEVEDKTGGFLSRERVTQTAEVTLQSCTLKHCIHYKAESTGLAPYTTQRMRMHADNEKLKHLLKSEIGKAPGKPTKDMYQVVIDSYAAVMERLIIVFSSLTMSMGPSWAVSDDIKLTTGSVIDISGPVMDGVVSRVENELCRAFIQMYLGDDPLDKEAKEKFGMSFLSLF